MKRMTTDLEGCAAEVQAAAIDCPHQPDVAAFLLGALTPMEERSTMAHVSGCAICKKTLREFAGLPDMLALVPRSVVELMDRSRSGTGIQF